MLKKEKSQNRLQDSLSLLTLLKEGIFKAHVIAKSSPRVLLGSDWWKAIPTGEEEQADGGESLCPSYALAEEHRKRLQRAEI